MSAEPGRFAALFDKPSVEAMHQLSARDFERFVAYVLRRAGYEVREVGPHFLRGVDLEMRVPNETRIYGGVECKRFAPDQLVPASVVMHVMGAPAVGDPNTKPFVITTSDFKGPAHEMAEAGAKRVYLLNGAQLVRYIRYVRGSRRDDDSIIVAISPEFFAGREPTDEIGGANVLTIANNKGGVGKTTTAYYLGEELARRGDRVLLIDLDGQANLTEWFFPEWAGEHDTGTEHFPNIATYFSGDRALSDLAVATGKARLSIIPSDPFLTLRDLGGSGRPDIELRFRHDVRMLGTQPLASLGGVPDWIIIDTPPAMTALSRVGLAAAHYVLAPIRPRRVSLAGTKQMLKTLRTMNGLTDTPASFLGIVVTHSDGLKYSQNVQDLLLPPVFQEYGGKVFTSTIPMDNQLETLEAGAKTPGAKAYTALAEEVWQDVHSRRQPLAVEVRH